MELMKTIWIIFWVLSIFAWYTIETKIDIDTNFDKENKVWYTPCFVPSNAFGPYVIVSSIISLILGIAFPN